jgi:hypothetical protein
VDARFAKMLSEWEEEVKRAEAEREAKRLVKCATAEEMLAANDDGKSDLMSVELRNGMDPTSSVLKQLHGFTASMGITFDDMNAVKALKPGGTALVDGQLRPGDIVIAAEGSPLKGVKASEAMEALGLPVYRLTIARPTTVRQNGTELPTGDHHGWLYVVRAKMQFKGMKALHPSRKVWSVIQGSTLVLYETQRRADSMVERPLALKGSNCKAYQKPKGGGKHHLPIVAEMYERERFPFRLNWAAAEVEYDLICSAETADERKEWVGAFEEAINAAPLAGWLKKRRPKAGFSMKTLFKEKWERFWFELIPTPRDGLNASLTFYESPDDMGTPSGIVVLNKDAELEVTDEFARKGLPHVFAVVSQGAEDPKPVRTYLAAAGAIEMEKWKSTMSRALRSFHQVGPCWLLLVASGCCCLLPIADECCRMLPARCCRMLLVIADCFRLLPIASDCFRLMPIDADRCQLMPIDAD